MNYSIEPDEIIGSNGSIVFHVHLFVSAEINTSIWRGQSASAHYNNNETKRQIKEQGGSNRHFAWRIGVNVVDNVNKANNRQTIEL